MPASGWPQTTRNLNYFLEDRNLRRFLERSAPAMLQRQEQALESLGAFCGGELDAQAAYSDRIHPPAIDDQPRNFAKPSIDERNRIVYLNPRYEAAQQELYKRGLLAQCFDAKTPESPLLPFVAQYLVSTSDIATGCPFAMTHPVALLLDKLAPAALKARFLPEMLRADGHTPIGGTWATEQHSGSDVGNSTTRAVQQPDGTMRLYGHNWFASAIGFNRFLTIKTARPEGAPEGGKGLGLYLVPSHIDPDWTIENEIDVVRLKRKVGTRDLPTAEIKLEGTLAYELAPAGQGLRMMMEALACSRVHNSMAAAGAMHRALMEAMCWINHRDTFNALLIERETIVDDVLDIQTEWLGGSALAFEAARSYEAAQNDPDAKSWSRIATALAKYRTAEGAVWCANMAMDIGGGNFYTEDYPVARLFRDAKVLTLWEGPKHMQAKELMGLLQQGGAQIYMKKLADIHASLPPEMTAEAARLKTQSDEMGEALRDLTARPKAAARLSVKHLHNMSNLLAYALLCEEGAWELQHCNDAEKTLFAERFHDRAFVRTLRPSLDAPLLEQVFKQVASGQGIRPGQLPPPPVPPAP